MVLRFNRRAFSRMCAGAACFGLRLLRANQTAPLTWAAQPSGGGQERRYRADAQIVLLSIPVLHRSGVGDGAAIWRESVAEDRAVMRLLEFTGRSAPEHAAGLNRFGFIQELSRTVDRTYSEALYFGLMTSSPEETAADARKALHSDKTEAAFSVIDARIEAGSVETAGAHFIAPARTSAADREALIERARQALQGAPRKREGLPPNGATPRPFLHAMADLLSRADSSETQYQYNGRTYVIHVERAPDPKVAAVFRQQRLIAPTAAVTRLTGTLKRPGLDKPIEFRLWVEEGSARPIPLRIEYQPKSYLRLTFEAVS